MQVRAVVSFSDVIGSYAAGQEFELPDGVDWVEAGLVEVQVVVVPESEPEQPKKAKRVRQPEPA